MPEPGCDRRRFLGTAALAGLVAAAGAGAVTESGPAGAMRMVPSVEVPADALNVRSFGARGTGKSDDTAAIQKALDAAGRRNGQVVTLPAGNYLLRGSLHVPENVTLQGCFRAPPRPAEVGHEAKVHGGSMLVAVAGKGQADGNPLISLHANSTLYGLGIFYPEQTAPDPPVAYPWTVRQVSDNAALVNVLIINPWQAVDCGTVTGGRHYIHGLYAQPLKTGLYIDRCLDVGRVENVHFWPFWSSNPETLKFTSTSATAFLIGRTDWQYMLNCFAICCSTGYHFMRSGDGAPNVLLMQCGCDEGAAGTHSTSVLVDALEQHAGVSFVNGQFMGAPSIRIGGGCDGPVKFTNCGFWGGAQTDAIAILAGTGHTTFMGCHFEWWGRQNHDAPAIELRTGSITVNGCEFLDEGKKQVAILGGKAAIITANRVHGPARIINHIGSRAKIALNAVG